MISHDDMVRIVNVLSTSTVPGPARLSLLHEILNDPFHRYASADALGATTALISNIACVYDEKRLYSCCSRVTGGVLEPAALRVHFSEAGLHTGAGCTHCQVGHHPRTVLKGRPARGWYTCSSPQTTELRFYFCGNAPPVITWWSQRQLRTAS
ncbi:hypothetical protein BV25DRAFT_1484571 [Artomyces pyxidatus]|uniref:Uncharacterized protein n=1 Tax=Artomyces pyxidatus TaxID=48021 RepID=A0ACB8TCD2_9AGAM|nr:hypothetical protein BV25DRAFT_1484571 [Artomyces pyxidatus]